MTSPAAATDAGRRRQQWLDQLAHPVRARLRLAAACNVLAGCLLVPQAAVVAWVLQAALAGGRDPRTMVAAFAMLAALLVVRAALAWGGQEAAGEASEHIRKALRARLYRQLLDAGPVWLRARRTGALAELMSTHVDALDGYFAQYRPLRVEVVAVPLVILAAVTSADRVVGLVLLFTAPLVPFFMVLVGWGAQAASRRQLVEVARMSGHFADRLKGLGLIRVYGRAAAELDGIARVAEGVRMRTLAVLRVAFLSSAVLEFFASVSVAVVALYLGLAYLGLVDLRSSALTLGTGVFCLLLAPEFFAPLRRLATHYHDRANALAAAGEIEAGLEGTPDAATSDAGRDGLPAATGSAAARQLPAAANVLRTPAPSARATPALRAVGLSLRPPGARKPVLQAIGFELAAGRRMALVGPSGCGKTTLLEAIAGWLSAAAGTLQVLPAASVGHVGQQPYLFPGSIADNLRLARPGATDAELRAAADAAQVLRFADKLPQGLDTVIGERGFGLSGGEARRVGVARLFLRDPGLVLLDEPTAFLDADTESALLAALDRFLRGRTVVLATHSARVVALADGVLQLPQGRLLAVADGIALCGGAGA